MGQVELAATLVNGAVTLALGVAIVYFMLSRKLEKHVFYFSWAVGFIFYGLEILVRGYVDTTILSILGAIMYLSMVAGAWGLSPRKLLLVVPVTVVLLSIWMLESLPTELFPAVFFLVITVGVAYNRVIFGKVFDKIIVGWVLLLITNCLLWGHWTLDVLATIAKFLIFMGILDQEFTLVAEKIRASKKYPPATIETYREGSLVLVIPPQSSSRKEEIRWIESKVKENVARQLDTYILCFHSILKHEDLRRLKWMNPERVYVIIFSSGLKKAQEEFTVLDMDISSIGACLTEITRMYSNKKEGCDVILVDLSVLIHSFSANNILNMLLEKMGSIRESGVNLYAIFHPETFSDPSVEPLFKKMSDAVVNL
jgi:hypothetical protein